jgi:hypothetical protein
MVKYFIHSDVQIISYLCHVEDKMSTLSLWPVIQKIKNQNLSTASGEGGGGVQKPIVFNKPDMI